MKLRLFLLITAIAAVFFGCDEDFEVFAPYKTIPVVFGVINSNDTTHYIKINRTFQGEGDNLEAAQIADSTAISVSNVQIEFLNGGGGVEKTTVLTRDTLPPRKPGDFYREPNAVYTFEEANVSNYAFARLSFDFEGQTLTSVTPVVKGLRIRRPFINDEIRFVANDILTDPQPDYVSESAEFTTVENGRRYQAFVVFKYREYFMDGSVVDKEFEEQIINSVQPELNVTRDIEGEVVGNEFMTRLALNIKPDPAIIKREILGVDFRFEAVGEDLYIFEQSTNSAIGLGQEIVNFSNVFYEDGTTALGVFGAASSVVRKQQFAKNTLVALIAGDLTGDIGFCSNNDKIILAYPEGACD